MIGYRGPFILQRFFTIQPLRNFSNSFKERDNFYNFYWIAIGIVLVYLFTMFIIEQNGTANCVRNYGQDYSYDTHASGDNAAKKCVNDKTKERKPIVVEKQS